MHEVQDKRYEVRPKSYEERGKRYELRGWGPVFSRALGVGLYALVSLLGFRLGLRVVGALGSYDDVVGLGTIVAPEHDLRQWLYIRTMRNRCMQRSAKRLFCRCPS